MHTCIHMLLIKYKGQGIIGRSTLEGIDWSAYKCCFESNSHNWANQIWSGPGSHTAEERLPMKVTGALRPLLKGPASGS